MQEHVSSRDGGAAAGRPARIAPAPKIVTVISPGVREADYWQDVWRHRELIVFLAWRDMLVRYKQTVLGISWTVIKPLATILVYTFVFGTLAQLPSTHFPL